MSFSRAILRRRIGCGQLRLFVQWGPLGEREKRFKAKVKSVDPAPARSVGAIGIRLSSLGSLSSETEFFSKLWAKNLQPARS